MRLKGLLSAILLAVLGTAGLRAQEVIPATGGTAAGSGGSVSYSVGQVVYTTNTGSTGSVAQGVQQPYEISVVTGLKDIKGITLNCSVYPNPTTDYLTLKIDVSTAINIGTLSYLLYDLQGRLLVIKKLEDSETSIEMVSFASATYFLKVIQFKGITSQREIKTFKIIKN